jgi:tetratricopeptide (TPR) repeat protein
MTAARLALPAGLACAAAVMALPASTAEAQPGRLVGCELASNAIKSLRRVRPPATTVSPAKLARAVATGRLMGTGCRRDDIFLIGYALARIDLAGDIRNTPLETRTAYFNAGLTDLELVRRRVLAGQSDRVEIFSVLGKIYNDIQQYEKSIAVILESAPYFGRLSPEARRDTLFTKGLAYYHLGRRAEAAVSFANAKKFGHPEAARWEARVQPNP